MPAYAIREWRQEEKPKALPEQIIETIDSCEDAAKTAKSRLKSSWQKWGFRIFWRWTIHCGKHIRTICSPPARSNRLTVISLRMTGQNRRISADE